MTTTATGRVLNGRVTDLTRAQLGLRSERGPVLLAVMLSTALIAIDATILATAVPSIVEDLGSLAQFPWLFSIYLLAQAATVPLYGRFADVIGRKPIMLLGIGIFLLGSVLSGVAWSMTTLIAFRLIQGIGAGAILPMGLTIVGDIYSVAERAKIQGYLGAVWGIAAVVGPTLGGIFSEYLTWRWIFYVNVPVGLLAAFLVLRNFKESVERQRHRIDYAGSLLLIVGCSLLILGLLEGGVLWAWSSTPSIAILSTGVVLLVGFFLVEQRTSEPIVPIWVLRDRLLVGTNTAAFIIGVLTIGLTSYVPLFAQHVLGAGAVAAGFVVATMSIGWPLASAPAGRLYLRIGFRNTSLIGAAVVIAGAALLLLVGESSSLYFLAVGCFVVGVGLGLVAAPTLVAAQSYVGWSQRGVVTGVNAFFRSVGSAVGVAALGAIANSGVTRRLGAPPSDLATVPPSVLSPAVHEVFIAAVVAGVLLVGAALIMPLRIKIADDDA